MQEETELNGHKNKVCKRTLPQGSFIRESRGKKKPNELCLARKPIGLFIICSFCVLSFLLFYPNMALHQGPGQSRAPTWPTASFCKYRPVGARPRPFLSALFACSCAQQQSRVDAPDTTWPTRLNIFTIWPTAEKVC